MSVVKKYRAILVHFFKVKVTQQIDKFYHSERKALETSVNLFYNDAEY